MRFGNTGSSRCLTFLAAVPVHVAFVLARFDDFSRSRASVSVEVTKFSQFSAIFVLPYDHVIFGGHKQPHLLTLQMNSNKVFET